LTDFLSGDRGDGHRNGAARQMADDLPGKKIKLDGRPQIRIAIIYP